MKNKLFVLLSAIFGIALCACSDDFWESRQLYYKTDYGKAPKSITVQSDDVLTSEQLPSVMVNGREFQGWYDEADTTKTIVKAGQYKVSKNTTLVAKWSDGSMPKWESWKSGNGTITVYVVNSSEEDDTTVTIKASTTKGNYSSPVDTKTVQIQGEEVGSATFNGLSNGTTYYFQMSKGDLINSYEFSATPKAEGDSDTSNNTPASNTGKVQILIK